MTMAWTLQSSITGAAKPMHTDNCNDHGLAPLHSSNTIATTLMHVSLNVARYTKQTMWKWHSANMYALMMRSQRMRSHLTAKHIMTIHTESWRLSVDGSRTPAPPTFFTGKSHTVMKSCREKIRRALKPKSGHRTRLRIIKDFQCQSSVHG